MKIRGPGATGCAECGAAVPAGGACEESFQALLAREWEVVHALGDRLPVEAAERTHFLAVGSYVLQHPRSMRYTEASLQALREMMALRLQREPLTFHLRRVARAAREEGLVRRRPGDPVPSWGAVAWEVTVGDALQAPVERYVAVVEGWARSTLRQVEDRQG